MQAQTFTSLSDKNKKRDIQKITNSLDIVKQIDGVRYKFIGNNKVLIGVIAQEVEKVLPEVVDNVNGLKSVSYGNITALLIESIKEQQLIIERMEERINRLSK